MLSNSVIASIIKLCHWGLILFILLAPILGSEMLLTYHTIIIPGILIHWLTNNNMCSLTLLESKLTNTPTDKTFIGKILFPFFEVNNYAIYAIIIGLWLFSIYRLQKHDFKILRKTLSITWSLFYKAYSLIWNIITWPINVVANFVVRKI
jgi:hypothetical protein